MAGSFEMARKLFSQWYFQQITAPIQTRQKVSKLSSLNVVFTKPICKGSVRRSATLCESNTCCNKRILELQPDFMEQKSLVQETIEAAGHLCLFLPKFHCELNPIEYFWGTVKKHLHDHCDYSFDGLKENLPKALDSVPIQTIRRWEHRLFHWVDAYWAGLGSVEAQLQVKKFSSRQYKSHRRIPENVATIFDRCMYFISEGRQSGSNEKNFSLKSQLNKNSSGQFFLNIKIHHLY